MGGLNIPRDILDTTNDNTYYHFWWNFIHQCKLRGRYSVPTPSIKIEGSFVRKTNHAFSHRLSLKTSDYGGLIEPFGFKPIELDEKFHTDMVTYCNRSPELTNEKSMISKIDSIFELFKPLGFEEFTIKLTQIDSYVDNLVNYSREIPVPEGVRVAVDTAIANFKNWHKVIPERYYQENRDKFRFLVYEAVRPELFTEKFSTPGIQGALDGIPPGINNDLDVIRSFLEITDNPDNPDGIYGVVTVDRKLLRFLSELRRDKVIYEMNDFDFPEDQETFWYYQNGNRPMKTSVRPDITYQIFDMGITNSLKRIHFDEYSGGHESPLDG